MLLRAARLTSPGGMQALARLSRAQLSAPLGTGLLPARQPFATRSVDAIHRPLTVVRVVRAGTGAGVLQPAPGARAAAAPPALPSDFAQLGLTPQLVAGLEQQGITAPTEIQVRLMCGRRPRCFGAKRRLFA